MTNKIQKLDIHTRSINHIFCYVFVTDVLESHVEPHVGDILEPHVGDILKPHVGDVLKPHIGDILEPHVGELTYTKNNVISEVHTIVKALEYLNFTQIKYDPICIYTSNQEAIDFIHECIYNRKNDKLVQKILLLLSDKNVKFFYINHDQNHANSFIN